jgi:hypothetical protein
MDILDIGAFAGGYILLGLIWLAGITWITRGWRKDAHEPEAQTRILDALTRYDATPKIFIVVEWPLSMWRVAQASRSSG